MSSGIAAISRILCCKDEKNEETLQELKKDIEMDEHEISIEELCKRLETDLIKGHTEEEAQRILKRNGPNALTPSQKTPAIITLLTNLFGGFNFLLWIGSFASILSYVMECIDTPNPNKDNLYLGIVLAVVVSITGIFAFYQERKSTAIMEGFAKMIPPKAIAIRNGKTIEMNASDVVVGDIVLVSGGDRVPADIRIITASGFKVDNSSLTGESEPQRRTPEFTSKNPIESKNVALFSTNVVEGQCKGIVILTGDKTVMGRIAALTSHVSSGETPIAKEIGHFIHIIGTVAVFIGVVFFTISLAYGYGFLQALVFLIGIIVANVPEGIVATVTVCLTLTAVKMRKKNCLVRKLQAVETLGSTSAICSDKTGTLTQNRMTVTHIWSNDTIYSAIIDNSESHSKEPKLDMKEFCSNEGPLLRCACLCSRAVFKDNDRLTKTQKRVAVGDASEVAIMKYCEMLIGDVYKYRNLYPKVCEIPFSSTNKYQVSIHRANDGKFILVMKGAPEKILSRCKNILLNGENKPITQHELSSFQEAYIHLGGLGERILGFCDLELDSSIYGSDYKFDSENINFPLDGLRFLGLYAMIDPPRPAVPHAVELCQSAGIKVIMVTGDHPITAQAIAKQVNIINPNSEVSEIFTDGDKLPSFKETDNEREENKKNRAVVINGEQLKKFSTDELDQLVSDFRQVVFSRTSPAQKLQIVEAYQRAGNVVAVTGDGVNDAPALRHADIGIAMGISGTDVSKQAADMILLDDNFASIVTGVEEGRIIFDNLKKSIAYTLTSNIPEIMPFITYVLIGIPLPMSVAAILCIDLGTDLWPAISIAYEEAESDIMKRAPRNPERDKLVNARLLNFSYLQIGVMQATAGFMTYLVIMAHNGFLPERLLFIREEWDNEYFNELEDSFGQQWTYQARKDLEHCCHGAFFYAIVVVQWADLLISKTRLNSIVTQGMTNHILNGGLVFTTILSMILLYTPMVNKVFSITPLRLIWAMVAVPYGWLIFCYDEIRKYFCRKFPDGWVYKETYY